MIVKKSELVAKMVGEVSKYSKQKEFYKNLSVLCRMVCLKYLPNAEECLIEAFTMYMRTMWEFNACGDEFFGYLNDYGFNI